MLLTAYVFYEAAEEAGLRPQKVKAGLIQPRPSPRLPEASHDRPPTSPPWRGDDFWACDFAVTCLRPVTRNPGPTASSTQNLAYDETLKRTFHDTANRCHQNGLRFTLWFFGGHAGGWQPATSSPGPVNASAPPPTALRATSISNWVRALLHHSTVTPRVPFCDVSA